MDPLFLSPALPSDLLQFIINSCTYPTTLIICADRADFLSSLTQDILHQQQQPQSLPADQPLDTPNTQQATTDPSHSDPSPLPPPPDHNSKPVQQHQHQQPPQPKPHPLLTPHLAQLVTTRSIRTVFVPTVTHLRAYLSVFSAHPSPSPPLATSTGKRHNKPPQPPAPPPAPPTPPPHQEGGGGGGEPASSPPPSPPPPPRLVVYNFLALHRGSSEWSVQGLGASSAVLVEAGKRERLEVVVVEGLTVSGPRPAGMGVGVAEAEGEEEEAPGPPGVMTTMTMGEMLAERVPVLSGGGRKVGGELEGSGWVGKTVGVGRVLGRWFRFREGEWAVGERVGDKRVVEDKNMDKG